MRRTFLMLASLPLVVSASGGEGRLSKQDVIELARKASYRYCHDHFAFGEFERTRCEFFAYFKNGEWIVAAHPIYENRDGKEAIIEGGDRLYYYSLTGKMLKAIDN